MRAISYQSFLRQSVLVHPLQGRAGVILFHWGTGGMLSVALIHIAIPANVARTAGAGAGGSRGGFLAMMLTNRSLGAKIVRRIQALQFVQILPERGVTTVRAMTPTDNVRAMRTMMVVNFLVGRISRVRRARDNGM